jgi:hypothetical protein
LIGQANMPVSYPLAASAIADVCAISSALILLFSRPKRLELPTTNAGDRDERLEGEDRKDPFDIATSEDMIDGYPIHEEKFWSQVRLSPLVGQLNKNLKSMTRSK